MQTNNFGDSIFNKLPKGVAYTNMPDKCKQLYLLILERDEIEKKFENTKKYSQTDFADELNCSKKSITRHLTKLENFGLIKKIKNPGSTTEYIILDVLESKLAEEAPDKKNFKSCKAKTEAALVPVTIEKKKKERVELTPEQADLKLYIETKTNEKLTNKKMLIIWNTALNNKEIPDNIISEKIKMIVDSVAEYSNNIRNCFGYIKKSINNYKAQKSTPDNPYSEIAASLQQKLENEYPTEYHFSEKQCIALCSIADKKIIKTKKTTLSLTAFIISEVINKSRSISGIKDIFRYMIQIINNFGSEQYTNLKKKKYSYERKEQSYDINEFKNFAVTFSGNTKKSDAAIDKQASEPKPEAELTYAELLKLKRLQCCVV